MGRKKTNQQKFSENLFLQDRIKDWLVYRDENQVLDLSFMGLEKMPILPKEVKKLNISNNFIVSIKFLPPFLTSLECDRNELQAIQYFPKSLEYIDCHDNWLKELPPLPPKLKYLDMNNNPIHHLPSLPLTLEYLNCRFCEIETVESNLPESLKSLCYCFNDIEDTIALCSCSFSHDWQKWYSRKMRSILINYVYCDSLGNN